MRTTAAAAKSSGSGELLLGQLVYGIIELIGFGYCSFQQIITTHDSVVGILQGGILIPSTMTAIQLLGFLQSNMDKFNKIAYTVAIITQIIYWGAAMPGSPIHNKWLHKAIIWGFFVLEIVTDLWYSIATSATIGGAIVWVFNFSNGGWIVSLSYIAAMSVGSMFLGIRGVHHVSKALAPVFARSATV